MNALNLKEEVFCLEYVKSGNGAKSATLAGYAQNSSRVTASKLLTKPNIQERIKYLKENIAEALGFSAVKIANELGKIAFSNISDTRSSWMSLKDFKKLSETEKAAIAEIHHEHKIISGRKVAVVKIKMHSKINAIAELNKMLGYNAPEKHELTGRDGTPIQSVTQHRVIFENNANGTAI